uniref:Suppressor of cytokine signaling 5a n=1 Tax=Denticeps clupeoides TaxID=299321 RepID=A0AAY4C4U6_9TELE
MERAGKAWSNLKRGCQNLLRPGGGPRAEDRPGGQAADAAPPPVGGRTVRSGRSHNCVAGAGHVFEITVEQEMEAGAPGPRRDSYSRHAPWSGKKRHSCSTKAQSSLESRSHRGAGGGQEEAAGGVARGGTLRSLRRRLRDAVGRCFPLPSAPKRKIHLTELMLETCPFQPGSDLARKSGNLIKQHTRAPPAPPPPTRPRRRRPVPKTRRSVSASSGGSRPLPPSQVGGAWKVHTQMDFIHCLVPDLWRITALSCYWGGTFLLPRTPPRNDFLFSVSFRPLSYGAARLHAQQSSSGTTTSASTPPTPACSTPPTVTALLEHYKDPSACMFFEAAADAAAPPDLPLTLQGLAAGGRVPRRRLRRRGLAWPPPPRPADYLREYHYKQRCGACTSGAET